MPLTLVLLVAALLRTTQAFGVVPRVVGGYPETNRTVIQWQALILRDGKVHCGGALLSPTKILTAAHCDVHKYMVRHAIVIGHASFGKGVRRYRVVRVFVHERYHTGSKKEPVNDVAIVEFHDPQQASGGVYPRINRDPARPHPRDEVFVSGFGKTSDRGATSDVLLTARLGVVPTARCMGLYAGLSMRRRICAGSISADSCAGDSGAALYDARLRVLGVVSFGKGCAHYRSPGIYARVSSYAPWIDAVLAEPRTPYFSTQAKVLIGGIAACAAALLLVAAVLLACVVVRKIALAGEDPKNAPWFATTNIPQLE